MRIVHTLGIAKICLGIACVSMPAALLAEDGKSLVEDQGSAANISIPRRELSITLDQILVAVEKYPGDANRSARREKLRAIIAPRFDFEEMAKRCLGAQWQERKPDEQKEFVSVFSELLASTYLGRIETVKRGMVKIEKENVELPRAIVRTAVTSKGETFPIDYKLINESGDWKVYDVVIENIGLVANYRNEFAGIIRKDGFEGLMVKLREKAKKIA